VGERETAKEDNAKHAPAPRRDVPEERAEGVLEKHYLWRILNNACSRTGGDRQKKKTGREHLDH